MRITIRFDSASTEAVREICVALNQVGLTAQLKVGVNGPEAWCGETPPLTSAQWARVACRLVKYDGRSVADTLDGLKDQAYSLSGVEA